jgi:hypothetical protein
MNSYFRSGIILREWFKSTGLSNTIRINPDKAASAGVERFVLCYARSENELNKLEEFFINPVLENPGCLNRKEGGRSGVQSEEVWTIERRKQQSRILKEHEINLKKSQDYNRVVQARKQRGVEFAKRAKQDKINNLEKYKKIYEADCLRKKFSDAQIKTWQNDSLRRKHQVAWSEEKRKYASERESAKWMADKRAEKSKKYTECCHWTNGIDDVYQNQSLGNAWVSARLGTKKVCNLFPCAGSKTTGFSRLALASPPIWKMQGKSCNIALGGKEWRNTRMGITIYTILGITIYTI